MNSRNTLLAILGGVAVTAVIGILLTRDSANGKKIVEKAEDFSDTAEETIEESVANVKTHLKKMGEDAERMVNEGGNTI